MTFSNRTNMTAAGCLALALALPLGVAGCTQADSTADQGNGTPAAEASANQGSAQATESGSQDANAQIDQRVTAITYYDSGSDESISTSYTYDDAGRLTAAEDATMIQKWSYDDAGRLVKEETSYAADDESDGGDQTITYTYDGDGTLVERIFEDTTGENLDYETGEPMTDPDTGAVLDDYKRTYTYEDDGKKMTTTVTNVDGQWIGGTVSTFTESAKGLFPTVSVKPEELGMVEEPWKPAKEETLAQDGTVTESSEYTYNEAGDITTLTSTYDDEEGSEKIIWTSTYDDKGNETMTTVAMEGAADDETQETPTEWTYNEAGQAIEKVSFDPFFGTTYEFYTYDSAGRLKSITYVQPQDGSDHLVGCQIYDYATDNEEPSSTPQQLMDEAAAKVPVQESSDEGDDEFVDGEEIDLSELDGLDLSELDTEDIEGEEAVG